jgi:hypothetical protein
MIGTNVCTAVDTGTTVVAGRRWNADMFTIVAEMPISNAATAQAGRVREVA